MGRGSDEAGSGGGNALSASGNDFHELDRDESGSEPGGAAQAWDGSGSEDGTGREGAGGGGNGATKLARTPAIRLRRPARPASVLGSGSGSVGSAVGSPALGSVPVRQRLPSLGSESLGAMSAMSGMLGNVEFEDTLVAQPTPSPVATPKDDGLLDSESELSDGASADGSNEGNKDAVVPKSITVGPKGGTHTVFDSDGAADASDAEDGDGDKRPRSGARRSRYFSGPDLSTKCYRCGEVGHIANDCLNEVKLRPCYLCAGVGHRVADCPEYRCYRCYQRGHSSSFCPVPRGSLPDQMSSWYRCYICGDCTHTSEHCRIKSRELPLVACVACGDTGHPDCSARTDPAPMKNFELGGRAVFHSHSTGGSGHQSHSRGGRQSESGGRGRRAKSADSRHSYGATVSGGRGRPGFDRPRTPGSGPGRGRGGGLLATPRGLLATPRMRGRSVEDRSRGSRSTGKRRRVGR